MAGPIKVFVCYKKLLWQEVAGQRVGQKNVEADILHHLLSEHGDFEVWVDNAKLAAGMKWETEIYQQLLRTDVLVVLIGPGTSESEWVRREIALANALGIAVVPVGFDLSDDQMRAETRELAIDDLQWVTTRNIRLPQGRALLAELEPSLRQAAVTTRHQQRTVLRDLLKRQRPQVRKAADRQSVASFEIPGAPRSLTLHLASGDMAKVRNIDVLVNSENNYMQMARFFESQTVSSVLRHRGASLRNGTYRDTIQRELDWQLRDRGRPVQAGEVFPTSAGGPDSELARVNKARVILHVAAVQAVEAENRVVPFKQPHQIESSMRAALAAISTLNGSAGVFSPPGSDQRAEQERLAAEGRGSLESIIFPLLGTGSAGAEPVEVVGPMVDGLVGYLSDSENRNLARTLRRLYFSAYAEEDVEVVKDYLEKRLGSRTATRASPSHS
ncbi:TIR domain-containing protein [Plantactinospora sp. WMMB334]|uniref:TIR domain-containing protein n=1 Tax=Plantactinospora sp. WMMB334 TaxID=3404119 RepID=UPI003B95F9AF